MKIFIEASSNQLISDPKFSSPVNSLTFKRGDVEDLQIYFCEDGSYVTPTSAREVVFGVKQYGAYDSTQFVVYADSPVIVGDYYKLSPNFNTQELNDLLLVDGLSTNDVESVLLMGEFTWSDTPSLSTWDSSNTFDVTVVNDVIRNNEFTPTALPTPETWLTSQLNTRGFKIGTAETAPGSNDEPAIITYAGDAVISEALQDIGTPVNGKHAYIFTDGIIEGDVIWVTGLTGAPATAGWKIRNTSDVLDYWSFDDVERLDQVENVFLFDGVTPISATFTQAGTPGRLGEEIIVAESEVWKCVREYPVKWIQLG